MARHVNRPGSGEVPVSPPVGFPLYGMAYEPDQPQAGRRSAVRWLDGCGDAFGEEVRWVRLCHFSSAAGSSPAIGPDPSVGVLISVETHSRALTDAAKARGGETALQSVAFSAAFTLVNVTLPDLSVPRPEGLTKALVNHAYARSKRYAQWAPVTWRVDGTSLRAKAWEFAGGWAAISADLDEVYLAASGSAGSPEGLALTRLRDTRAYNFALDQPLDMRVVKASGAAAWAEGEPAWRHTDWHADQLRLLPGRT